jgi:magnesium transporter
VAGIYGMNFEHMPELHWKYSYPAVLAAMVLIDMYLVKRFKDAHWL